MGTAGVIGELEGKFGGNLVVTNADVIHSVDLAAFLGVHEEQAADLSIVSMEYHHEIPFGVLDIDNHRIARISEKPSITRFVSAGIYAISDSIFRTYKFGERCDMTDIATHLIQNSQRVMPYFFDGFWRDVGNQDALEEISRNFQERSHASNQQNELGG